MNEKELLTTEFNKWIRHQVETGNYENMHEACRSIAKDVLKLKSFKSIEGFLYGYRFPVPAKHVNKLVNLTGIEARIFNPEVFE